MLCCRTAASMPVASLPISRRASGEEQAGGRNGVRVIGASAAGGQ